MTAEAERLCREVLELAPGQPQALAALWQICRANGRGIAAEALLRRIVQLHPNTLWATHELTLALLAKGAAAEAEIHARNAVRIAPENAAVAQSFGHGDDRGASAANRRIPLSPGHRIVRQARPDRLGEPRLELEKPGPDRRVATSFTENSAAAAPEVVETLLGWARMEEADRNFARAAEVLADAEALRPADPRILLTRAVIEARTGGIDAALAVLARAASATGGLGADELLQKGRLLDRIGRHDEAFAAFAEGKRQCREAGGLVYRAEEARPMAERLKAFFTEGRLQTLPRAATRGDQPQPIFILGFPRSGTTLVEQTLSAHPRIAAGDELPFVNEITASLQRTF